jgi:phospholipase/carboxylesterase
LGLVPLDELVHRRRPADGDPAGALILLHGRGVDENDLFPLLDLFDPGRRLEAFTPRAPLQPPGHTGNHWYVVERVGFPDRESFSVAYALLDGWLQALATETNIPPERMVLGGFSQGGVMSYAMGLGAGRPRPAAILAMSSFVPTVEGWTPNFTDRADLPVYHLHGDRDPIIAVEFGRQARDLLQDHVDLTYREHPGGHTIDPRAFGELRDFVQAAIPD